MKFKEFKSFRDYDRKFVKVTKINNKIKKELEIDNLEEPIYGILYIDIEYGITLRITGNEKINYNDNIILLRADVFNNIEFEIFNGNDYMKEILKQINKEYYNDNLNKLLSDKSLDEFRHPIFPNDVIAILPNNKQVEKIWVRLYIKTKEKDLYIGELLNTSISTKQYTTGKKVALVYYKNNNFKGLIIDGLVKIQD